MADIEQKKVLIANRSGDQTSEGPWSRLLKDAVQDCGYETELVLSSAIEIRQRLKTGKDNVKALILDTTPGADTDKTISLIQAAKRAAPSLSVGVAITLHQPSAMRLLFLAGATDIFPKCYEKDLLVKYLQEATIPKP